MWTLTRQVAWCFCRDPTLSASCLTINLIGACAFAERPKSGFSQADSPLRQNCMRASSQRRCKDLVALPCLVEREAGPTPFCVAPLDVATVLDDRKKTLIGPPPHPLRPQTKRHLKHIPVAYAESAARPYGSLDRPLLRRGPLRAIWQPQSLTTRKEGTTTGDQVEYACTSAGDRTDKPPPQAAVLGPSGCEMDAIVVVDRFKGAMMRDGVAQP